ncbi:MAG: D-alanyl-D-alanine carboxypeptidase family protein [Candidatus Sericytochromatia bacterium]
MGALSIYNPQSGISIGQVSQLLGRDVQPVSMPPRPPQAAAPSFQPDALRVTPRPGIPANGLLMTPDLLKSWNMPTKPNLPTLPSLPSAPVLPQRPQTGQSQLPSLPPLPRPIVAPAVEPEMPEDPDAEMEDPDLIDAPDEPSETQTSPLPSLPGRIPLPIPRPKPAVQDNTAVATKPRPQHYPAGIHDTGLKDKYGRKISLTGEAERGLREVLEIAKAKGIRVDVFSSYRSVEHQRDLFNKAVKKYGSVAKARKWVAPPGHSRHNFGQAIDVHMYRNGKKISQKEFDGIIAQAGMYRPMSWEGWHIEPLSTRKTRR